MNKEEFEKQYDEVLKEFGFIHKRVEKTTAGDKKYIQLIYETTKRQGFSDPTEILFVLFKNNEVLDDIMLYIIVKNNSHKKYRFRNMEDLISFLKCHKRGRGFNFDDLYYNEK